MYISDPSRIYDPYGVRIIHPTYHASQYQLSIYPNHI